MLGLLGFLLVDNVVNFPTKKTISDPYREFVLMHLIPWAESQGISIYTREFTLTGASIISLLQGLNVQ